MPVPDAARDALQRLQIALDDHQLDQLDRYLTLLLETNQQVNLTAVRDADAAWDRLIIDSLTVLPALDDLPTGARIIDVGTGGGLPGIPLAIARPDLHVTLLDATGKKCRFLEAAVQALELPHTRVVQGRSESLAHQAEHRQTYAAAIARAVGPMNVLLELTLPLVGVAGDPPGRVIAMKGPRAPDELDASADALDILGGGEVRVCDAYPEDADFDNDLVLVLVDKDRPTPRAYPRPPGTPKREPL
jgi:16S rRNA (guanine527-N7)-methyltransferase